MKRVVVAQTTLTAFTTTPLQLFRQSTRDVGNKHGWRYLDKYLIKIWAKTVFKAPEKVVSYVGKSWCRGHVDYDDVVILPIDKASCPIKCGTETTAVH
jgi:hypothetical protein